MGQVSEEATAGLYLTVDTDLLVRGRARTIFTAMYEAEEAHKRARTRQNKD